MKLSAEISTPRCKIDTLTPELVSQNHVDWLNNHDINRFLEARFRYHTLDTQKEYAETALQSNNHLLLNIYENSINSSIGTCSALVQLQHKTAEIGILIGEKSIWGQGYGQEVIAAFSESLFKTMGMRKITAGAYGQNRASIQLFIKCGFAIEGVRKSQVVGFNGVDDDVVIFGLMNPRGGGLDKQL